MWPMVLGWEHPRPQSWAKVHQCRCVLQVDERVGRIAERAFQRRELRSTKPIPMAASVIPFNRPLLCRRPISEGENWWLPQIQRWMVHIRCLYHHSNPCTVWECSLERKKHWIFNMWITYKWLTLLKTKDNPRLVGWGKVSQFFGELTRKASCSLPAAASAVCREEPSWGRPLGWLGVVG